MCICSGAAHITAICLILLGMYTILYSIRAYGDPH